MGIQWQTQLMTDGDVATFSFDDTVQGYFAGNAGFNLLYDAEHHVRNFGTILDATKVSSNIIQVTAHIILEDDSGHTGAPDYCWSYVTVVAWTGPSSLAVFLDTALPLCNNTQTLEAQNTVLGAGAALNSFRMAYEADDHNVYKISAGIGAPQLSGRTIQVSGSTEMMDFSGHHAACKNLRAGILASLVNEPEYEIGLAKISTGATELGTANFTTSISFTKPVSSATAILSSWEANYNEIDYNVFGILAGAMRYGGPSVKPHGYYGSPDSVSINGAEVTVTTNVSIFCDRYESITNKATFLVIAKIDSSAEA